MDLKTGQFGSFFKSILYVFFPLIVILISNKNSSMLSALRGWIVVFIKFWNIGSFVKLTVRTGVMTRVYCQLGYKTPHQPAIPPHPHTQPRPQPLCVNLVGKIGDNEIMNESQFCKYTSSLHSLVSQFMQN